MQTHKTLKMSRFNNTTKIVDSMKRITYTTIQMSKLNNLMTSCPSYNIYEKIYQNLAYADLISHIKILEDKSLGNPIIYFSENIHSIKNILYFVEQMNKLYKIYNDICFNYTKICERLLTLDCDNLFWLIKFELQIIEPLENYREYKLRKITDVNSLLNNIKFHVEWMKYENKNKNENELVLNKIIFYKEQLYSISTEMNIELSDELKYELSRSERIYRILITESQIEESVSSNLKQVIQNSDLNRYLMEFIE